MPGIKETGGSNVFSEGIGYNIIGTLMARLNLFGFIEPANVMVLEVDVTRFGWYEVGGGEVNGGGVVLQHYRWRCLRES